MDTPRLLPTPAIQPVSDSALQMVEYQSECFIAYPRNRWQEVFLRQRCIKGVHLDHFAPG